MADASRINFPIDDSVLELLACPACWGKLRLNGDELICANCSRSYPIVDGIPKLIAENAAGGASPHS